MPKNSEQIAIPFSGKCAPCLGKELAVELRQRQQIFVSMITFTFPINQIAYEIVMPDVALTQKLVAQHRAKGGGDRESDFELHASAKQALHHLQEWNITLADRFEEPVFFVKEFVFRMPHER